MVFLSAGLVVFCVVLQLVSSTRPGGDESHDGPVIDNALLAGLGLTLEENLDEIIHLFFGGMFTPYNGNLGKGCWRCTDEECVSCDVVPEETIDADAAMAPMFGSHDGDCACRAHRYLVIPQWISPGYYVVWTSNAVQIYQKAAWCENPEHFAGRLDLLLPDMTWFSTCGDNH